VPVESRARRYAELRRECASVLAGIDDPVAVMATAACLVFHAVAGTSFAGFYRVVAPGRLLIGPYQGPLGCLEIPFDRGVCGAAARTGRCQVVADVHAFPGHIACDAGARSEIVVPYVDERGEVAGVLDLDSHLPANFDDVDRRGLEAILLDLAPRLIEPRAGGATIPVGPADRARRTPGRSAG
jgi:GAF domain-containing protein